MNFMFEWFNRFTRIVRIHGNLIVIIFCVLVIFQCVRDFGGFREFISYLLTVEDSCEGEGH